MLYLLIILLPLISSFLVACSGQYYRGIAIFLSIMVFCYVGYVFFSIDYNAIDYGLLPMHFFKISSLSGVFILLTAFLVPLALLFGWNYRNKLFFILFLMLEAIIFAFFMVDDLVLFYICFEASLIPLFFIIGIWGSDDRRYSAFKFFLYTALGSVLLLIGIISLQILCGTTNITSIASLINQDAILYHNAQVTIWWLFFIALAVKVPMVPFHTWLPDAHVQAPTPGSVILAGILIKMGAYGMIKILLTCFPEVSYEFSHIVIIMSMIAVIYASLIILKQTDIKKMIAYSSVAHMGVVTAGLFSFSHYGISGAIFQMVSHGLISGALFMCVGILYERTHSRDLNGYGGLATKMPFYSVFFIVFTMGSIGLPGTSGFMGEFLSLMGVYEFHNLYGAILLIGVVLSAVYMLFLCKKVIWGEENINLKLSPLQVREYIPLFMIASLMLLLGIYPSILFDIFDMQVKNLLVIFEGI